MKYYEAYDERYKAIHKKGYSWSSDKPTPIVLKTISNLYLSKEDTILEIGCGEGRDAKTVLELGFNLSASDISHEAISYCKAIMPEYSHRFFKLDCLRGKHDKQYKFIYSIAVLHMLVLDEDRKKFYEFIYNHLENGGYALICSMGDGIQVFNTDPNDAFKIVKRHHDSGTINVTSTSCRVVSSKTFEKEIKAANLTIVKKGITHSLPDFDNLMYALVRKE